MLITLIEKFPTNMICIVKNSIKQENKENFIDLLIKSIYEEQLNFEEIKVILKKKKIIKLFLYSKIYY
jgi:hypothetical protein